MEEGRGGGRELDVKLVLFRKSVAAIEKRNLPKLCTIRALFRKVEGRLRERNKAFLQNNDYTRPL